MRLEHGSPISPDIPTAAAVVVEDTPCRSCGYNLRTQAIGGSCPECGSAVAISVSPNLLRYSDPGWVGKLAVGTGILLIASLFDLAVAILTMDWAATGSFHSAARQAFLRVLPFVNIIAGWVGYWLFTSADPGAAPADQHTGLRNFIRVFAVLMIVRGLLHLTETVYGGTSPAGHISNVIATGITIVGLAATFCELHYFGKLAVRIPDWKLASYANRLKVWLVLGDAYMLLVTAGIALLIRHPRQAPAVRGAIQPWVYVVVFVVMLILWSPSLIAHVFYILMLNRFRAAFKQEAAEARLRGSGVGVERQGGG